MYYYLISCENNLLGSISYSFPAAPDDAMASDEHAIFIHYNYACKTS